MTVEEIIQETVAYYLEDPSRRALIGEDNECVYENDDGKMCAVGRCMIPTVRKKYINLAQVGVEELIIQNRAKSIDDVILEPYRGHPIDFWTDLQSLHDDQCFWTHSDADNLRKKYVESMIKKYGYLPEIIPI